jgi:hypothetical protein
MDREAWRGAEVAMAAHEAGRHDQAPASGCFQCFLAQTKLGPFSPIVEVSARPGGGESDVAQGGREREDIVEAERSG